METAICIVSFRLERRFLPSEYKLEWWNFRFLIVSLTGKEIAEVLPGTNRGIQETRVRALLLDEWVKFDFVSNNPLFYTPRITSSNNYMSSGGITVYSGAEFKLILSGDGIEEIKEVLFTTSNSSFGESCYNTEGSYHTSDTFDKIERDPEAGLVVVTIGMSGVWCCFSDLCADVGLRQYDGQRTYYLCISTSEVNY